MDALIWVIAIAIGGGGVWYASRASARRAREDGSREP
jgi:hypothetical protein